MSSVDKVALDYFDASINRISAWVVGFRNFQKALLNALLTPNETLKQLQDEGRMTELMVKQEEIKTLPFGDVWAEYCEECGAPKDGTWFGEIEKYEETVLTKRVQEGKAVSVLDTKFVQGFIRMCNDGWEQGWHERNGGNLSYRIKDEEVAEVKEFLHYDNEWKPIGTKVPGLASEYFLVTGSGKYFRNVIIDPEDSICIIELDEKGENYRIFWGLVNGGRPTSELPSHLMNHEVKKGVTNEAHRVIYHAHTTNVIALTFVLPLEDKVFTRELWEMATECPVVFPSGIGVVGWMVPGGREIAVATSALMKEYDVAIWAHHGMFCSGEDFDLTFGLMHTVEKSAEILVKMLSMRPDKRQTISPQNFRDLAKDFKVTLPEKFLYDK